MRTIFKLLLFLLATLQFCASSEARASVGCGLPAGQYEHRKQAPPLSDAQREIDHTYVEFMRTVAQFYAVGDRSSVDVCCEGVKEDHIGFQFCALVRYLLSDRKEPGPFLAAMPENDEQRNALWFMELISAGGTDKTPTSLPGIRMPHGLLFKFVDEIFALMQKGNATAAERYLFLYDDANGEFGEYMDDQLPKLFLNYPQKVLVLWPVFQKHIKRLEMMGSFIEDADANLIISRYSALCKAGDTKCAEIRSIFVSR